MQIDPPIFVEYDLFAELAGAAVLSMKSLSCRIFTIRFICDPNNSTGTLFSREGMFAELDACNVAGTQLPVDEVFMDLSELEDSITDVRSKNLFVIRSLMKSFVVPGVRFGFAFVSPDLIGKNETARMPWAINVFAEYYARLAFAHYHELRNCTKQIAAERKWYYAHLDNLGLFYDNSSINYVLIHLNQNAKSFICSMIDREILVRDCKSLGFPEYIQVLVQTRKQNIWVLEAISACLH